jgi:predicted dehydrogenase
VLRLAIIGFGRLAQEYFVPAFRRLGTIQIVSVCDPLASSLSAAQAVFPAATRYTDHRTLLDHERIDALIVSSPPSTHLAVWTEAVRGRKPAFVEKPFVLGGELRQVDNLPDARGLLMPDFNRRFWPPYQRLREISLQGILGIVERAEFKLHINPLRWSSVTGHRLSADEGGALYDLGSSQLDLVEYVFNDRIERLRAQAHSQRWLNDHIVIDAYLRNGIRVSCDFAYGNRNEESITIVGREALVKLANPNGTMIVKTNGSRENVLGHYLRSLLSVGYRTVRRDQSMLRYSIRASLAEFVEAVSNQRPPAPNFDDAFENALCLEAAAQSMSKRSVVEVERSRS